MKRANLIVWYRISTTLSCPMKLQKYPLDTQRCPMQFESCKCWTVPFPQFWATVSKTVRPMLSDRCPVCPVMSCLSCRVYLPVCNVGALWPNGWMDQNETWRCGRPQPRPHCGRWLGGDPAPPKGHSLQFSAHVRCGQTAGWIKMSLGT